MGVRMALRDNLAVYKSESTWDIVIVALTTLGLNMYGHVECDACYTKAFELLSWRRHA